MNEITQPPTMSFRINNDGFLCINSNDDKCIVCDRGNLHHTSEIKYANIEIWRNLDTTDWSCAEPLFYSCSMYGIPRLLYRYDKEGRVLCLQMQLDEQKKWIDESAPYYSYENGVYERVFSRDVPDSRQYSIIELLEISCVKETVVTDIVDMSKRMKHLRRRFMNSGLIAQYENLGRNGPIQTMPQCSISVSDYIDILLRMGELSSTSKFATKLTEWNHYVDVIMNQGLHTREAVFLAMFQPIRNARLVKSAKK